MICRQIVTKRMMTRKGQITISILTIAVVKSQQAEAFVGNNAGINISFISSSTSAKQNIRCSARDFRNRYHEAFDDKKEIDAHILSHSPALSARNARIITPSLFILSSLICTSSIVDPAHAATKIEDKSLFVHSLNLNFPGSLPNSKLTARLLKSLHRYGYTPSNTLLATSLCSDELNSSEQSLESQLRKGLVSAKYGGVFHLGGLAGVPFVGSSGFKAMLGHVPLNGKVLIVFGPHIGIDDMGIVGSVRRNGQGEKPSASCGAIVGAAKAIRGKKKNSFVRQNTGPVMMDDEEDYIISYLTKVNSSTVDKDQDFNITSLTQAMYHLVRDQVLSQLQACINVDPTMFWSKISEITLLGGIVINTDYAPSRKDDDYFQPLMLQKLTAQGAQECISDVFS